MDDLNRQVEQAKRRLKLLNAQKVQIEGEIGQLKDEKRELIQSLVGTLKIYNALSEELREMVAILKRDRRS